MISLDINSLRSRCHPFRFTNIEHLHLFYNIVHVIFFCFFFASFSLFYMHISPILVRMIIVFCQTKFVLDYSNERDVEFVGQKMVSGYKTFKHLLKLHYEAFNTHEEAKNNPPHTDLWNRRPIVQWQWLCDYVYNDPTHMVCNQTLFLYLIFFFDNNY